MTVGRKKITNSVFWVASFLPLNALPITGIFDMPGTASVLRITSSCINPPKTAVLPLATCKIDSISRT